MKKYKTGGYGSTPIVEIECEKETAKSLWIAREWKDSRGVKKRVVDVCRKESGYYNYFDTWEEAHKYLLEEAERSVEDVKQVMQRAEAYLADIKGLKDD